MAAMCFKNIVVYVDGVLTLKNINFKIDGMTNLVTDRHDRMTLFFNALFKKRNGREEGLFVDGEIYVGAGKEEGLFVDGEVYFEGKKIQKNDFPTQMSRYKLFNRVESVREALYMIRPERAEMVLSDFRIEFGHSKLCDLTIGERRIFEILVEMVEMPRLVFIRSVELENKMRKKYLRLIRRYVEKANSVCLVQTEHGDRFDRTLVAEEGKIFSLSREMCQKYQMEEFFRQIDSCTINSEDKVKNKDIGDSDEKCKVEYKDVEISEMSPINEKCKGKASNRKLPGKKIDSGQNTQTLEKPSQLFFPRQLFNTSIYRAQLRQSQTLAFRKYNLMIRKYSDKINIYKNIGLFVILMLCIRAYQETNRELIRENIPSILCFFCSFLLYFYDFKIFIAIIFFLKYIFQELSWNRIFSLTFNFFRNSYTLLELKIVTSFVYFCIFFAGSTIMVEDRVFLRYYTPFLITPGTYIVSVFLYLFVTQFIVFISLGFIFNISSIFITTLNAVIANIAIACATTKRLRETLISLFIVLYFLIPIITASPLYANQKYIFFYLFPMLLAPELQYSGMSLFKILLVTLPFYALVYVISCYRVAFLAHKAF